jgi:hypothetical protein
LDIDLAPENAVAAGLAEPPIPGFQGGSEMSGKVLKINIGGVGVLIKW